MNLKEIRTHRGFSQRAVADGIGCSPTVYSRYENGERQPSIEMLISLSKFFGVSVDCLIGNSGGESLDDDRRPEASKCCFTAAEVELIMAARDSDERAMADALSLLKSHSVSRQNPHKENP